MSDNTTAIILGFFQLATAALAAYGLWQNAQLKMQSEKLQNQQAVIHQQINGITAVAVKQAGDLGQAIGREQGAAVAVKSVSEAVKLAAADVSVERIEEIRGGQQS